MNEVFDLAWGLLIDLEEMPLDEYEFVKFSIGASCRSSKVSDFMSVIFKIADVRRPPLIEVKRQ